MSSSAFRLGGWAALILGGLTAVAAATVLGTGLLALAGKVTYPVHVGWGPFSVRNEVSMPVGLAADVCQSADVGESAAPSDCLRFFMHPGDGWSGGQDAIRVQDADVRPTSATLTGTMELATAGGWSPFVAASIVRTATHLTVSSAVLLLLWRLLARASTGAVFSDRAVRHVRSIGWLLIGGGVVQAALGVLTGANQLGYSFEAFGGGPTLQPSGNAGIDWAQLALGGLILLVAEIFRHGAAVEAEQRLTV